MCMKLYEISAQMREFVDKVNTGLIPDDAIQDTLDSIQISFEDKADNTASFIKGLRAEAKAIKAEEDALKGRRQSTENKADRLEQYLADNMLSAGLAEVKTPRNRLRFRRSTYLHIDDEGDFMRNKDNAAYLRQGKVSISRAEVTKAIKDGKNVAGATLNERQNLQIE